MFATYKKIISPESSPILGPASPNLTPTNVNVNVNNANANVNVNNAMEPFSLYTCCCSNRTKKDSTILMENDIKEKEKEKEEATMVKSKYEFGHATHYVYGVTTPRLLCEFETGTPPSP